MNLNEFSNKVKKFKLKNIFLICFIVIICVCISAIFLLFFVSYNQRSYKDQVDDYLDSTKAISELNNTSTFLTRQTDYFTINLEKEFLDNYLNEIDVKRTRENSINLLKMTHDGDQIGVNATFGLNESYYLQKRELYAMKLLCDGAQFPETSIPEEIKRIQYRDGDEKLSSTEKLVKGRDIIFSSDYIATKNRLEDYYSKAQAGLVNNVLIASEKYDILLRFINILGFIISVFFIIFTVVFAIILFLAVLRPFNKCIEAIKKGEKADSHSFYELQYLIDTYNSVFDSTIHETTELRHKAEHDPLTNLINRNAFEEIKRVLSGSSEPIAFLLIDIDFFKKVNDDFGHLIGDEVLKKIARMLMEQFRSTDYVVRFGGDEFAIIMTKFGESPKEIIKTKIDNMNNKLQNVSDGLPSVSLSVGVAISQCGFIDSMVEFADEALYKVKRGGRCNCSFYQAEKLNKK